MPEDAKKPDEKMEELSKPKVEQVVAEKEEIELAVVPDVIEKKKDLRKASDIKCGQILELSKLTFQPNSSTFIREKNAKDYLTILVDFLDENSQAKIKLFGHLKISDPKNQVSDTNITFF